MQQGREFRKNDTKSILYLRHSKDTFQVFPKERHQVWKENGLHNLKTVTYASSAIAETAYCIDSIIVLRNVLKENDLVGSLMKFTSKYDFIKIEYRRE